MENYKVFIKKIEEEKHFKIDILSTLIGRLYIIKITMLPHSIEF